MSADRSARQPQRTEHLLRLKLWLRRTRPPPVGNDASFKAKAPGSSRRVKPKTSPPRTAKIQRPLRTRGFGDGHPTADEKRCKLGLTLESKCPLGSEQDTFKAYACARVYYPWRPTMSKTLSLSFQSAFHLSFTLLVRYRTWYNI